MCIWREKERERHYRQMDRKANIQVKRIKKDCCARVVLYWRMVHCVKNAHIRSYSGPHFPAFGLTIQFECGKMWTRITPHMGTFYAVIVSKVPYILPS